MINKAMQPGETIAIENLFNSWIRENRGHTRFLSNQILIELPALKRTLRLQAKYRSSSGELRGIDILDNDSEIGPMQLADLLAEEVRAEGRPEHSAPDWRENIAHSVHVTNRILKEIPFNDEIAFNEVSEFMASEQSLRLGHRFHPSPKARIGFSNSEIITFSPEFKSSFQLHYFLMDPQVSHGCGDTTIFVEKLKPKLNIAGMEGKTLLPLHPWQAKKILQDLGILNAIREGSIIDLGVRGPRFFPTASVRTLYQPELDFFIKCSLDIRITNCFRRNLLSERQASLRINQLLNEARIDTKSFCILREPGSIDFSEELGSKRGNFTASIYREGFGLSKTDSTVPLLAGSLFGDRQFSAFRLKQLCVHQNSLDLKWWWIEYLRLLVPPLMNAYWNFGIMFEPHLQNVVLGLNSGMPNRIWIRDLDNCKLIEGSASAAQAMILSAEAKKDLFFTPEVAWKRFVYCLIVNNLSEAVSTLTAVNADFTDTDSEAFEKELWSLAYDVFASCSMPPEEKNFFLKQRHLWAKKNMLARLTRIPDLEIPFSEIPNFLVGIS